jgi:hypothetical protein
LHWSTPPARFGQRRTLKYGSRGRVRSSRSLSMVLS